MDEEVRTQEGAWYRMRIMVYRPQEGSIEGVVLTFVNIDAQKEAQEQVREMGEEAASAERRYAQSIVDTVQESLLVLDSDLRVISANRSFYRTFGTSANATEGESLFDLQEGGWDFPELRTLLREILEKDRTFEGYGVEHAFPGIGHRRFLLNARKLRQERTKEDRILLALEDRTVEAS
jgi:two-component system CheB/CheR fusion protein